MGIESASADAVQQTEKFRPSTTWLEEKINLLLNNGINVAGNIIVGFPSNENKEYERTKSFIQEWRSELWFNIYGFVPYEGTPLYSQLVNDNRIKNWNFDEWCEGAPFVFEPYSMSSKNAYNWLIKMLSVALG